MRVGGTAPAVFPTPGARGSHPVSLSFSRRTLLKNVIKLLDELAAESLLQAKYGKRIAAAKKEIEEAGSATDALAALGDLKTAIDQLASKADFSLRKLKGGKTAKTAKKAGEPEKEKPVEKPGTPKSRTTAPTGG